MSCHACRKEQVICLAEGGKDNRGGRAGNGGESGMFGKKKKNNMNIVEFDRENQKPVLRCSICNGEQVAGLKDVRTGRFQEVMVIRSSQDLEEFRQAYGLGDVPKEY